MKTKEIIFFDGDGTLWYPKSTKRIKAPHWIYSDTQIGENYLDYLMLTPSLLRSLKDLKEKGIYLVALSTHPHDKAEADIIMGNKVKHFKLERIFDEVYTSRNYPEGKGEVILEVLGKMKIPKSRALMVGDNYLWDYLSAKRVGVDALLIRSEYVSRIPRDKNLLISDLSEITRILSI